MHERALPSCVEEASTVDIPKASWTSWQGPDRHETCPSSTAETSGSVRIAVEIEFAAGQRSMLKVAALGWVIAVD